jgi:hypothetical protein
MVQANRRRESPRILNMPLAAALHKNMEYLHTSHKDLVAMVHRPILDLGNARVLLQNHKW